MGLGWIELKSSAGHLSRKHREGGNEELGMFTPCDVRTHAHTHTHTYTSTFMELSPAQTWKYWPTH